MASASRGAPIVAAVILVAIGSLLALQTLDLSNASALLNLVHGPQVSPTLATLAAKKVAELILFAAFIDLAVGAGLGRGAIVGALALAAQPIASADSGAFFPLATGVALVLAGRSVAARIAPTVSDLVGAGLAFLGAILLSPWLLALLGILWLPRPGRPAATRVTWLGALALPFPVAFAVAITRGGPLVPPDPLAHAYDLGAVLLVSVPPASLAIVALALAFAVLASPPFVQGSISSLLAAALFFRMDLGAPFVATILFALTVAAAVDRASTGRPWAANLAAVTVFLFALAPTPTELLDQMRVKRVFDHGLRQRCGKSIDWPGASHGSLVRAETGERTRGGCWIAFANDHPELPGRYRAAFLAGAAGSGGSFVEVAQASGKKILANAPVPSFAAEVGQPLPRTFVPYEIAGGPARAVEHRVFFDGAGVLVFDGLEVEPLP